MTSDRPALLALELAEDPAAWAALGFEVEGDRCVVGSTELRLAGGDGGLTGWSLGPPVGPATAGPAHPNGAVGVDHVVLRTPDLERTVARLADDGLPCRRRREAGEWLQAFHVLANALIEVVGPAAGGHAEGEESLWGVTLVVADIDAAAALLGDRLGAVKDAVQPGRRIATVRAQTSGVRVPLAFITPRT